MIDDSKVAGEFERMRESIARLAKELRRQALQKLECAERTEYEPGKQLVTHGAFCQINAADELTRILESK